jgi:hypothetical protein
MDAAPVRVVRLKFQTHQQRMHASEHKGARSTLRQPTIRRTATKTAHMHMRVRKEETGCTYLVQHLTSHYMYAHPSLLGAEGHIAQEIRQIPPLILEHSTTRLTRLQLSLL